MRFEYLHQMLSAIMFTLGNIIRHLNQGLERSAASPIDHHHRVPNETAIFDDDQCKRSNTQIKEECFLEDVNNLLQSGEVPNLYGRDEIPQVLDGVRKAAKQASVEETTEALWAFFVDR